MTRILHVVGARPNFMKIAPVMRAIERRGFAEQRLLHTGQHYDAEMSDVFLRELGLPTPDRSLGVGPGSTLDQFAKIIEGFAVACREWMPDLVVVPGDVQSTLACALSANKLGVACAHIEAGLRSFDRSMPEETNRVLTDHVSDLLFTPSPDADENLLREGIGADRIHRVGNVMIDTLLTHIEAARSALDTREGLARSAPYALLTLHRPSNVDNPQVLSGLLDAIDVIQQRIEVVWPVHPRTRVQLTSFGLETRLHRLTRVRLLQPLGYLELLPHLLGCRFVLTDSGGLQEETTALGIPCLTARANTERPITLQVGTNRLVGTDPAVITSAVIELLDSPPRASRVPDLWDGHASERVADVIERWSRARTSPGTNSVQG